MFTDSVNISVQSAQHCPKVAMNSLKSFLTSLPMLLLSLEINFGRGVHVGPSGMKTPASLSVLFFMVWSSLIHESVGSTAAEVEQHLQLGQKMLAAGQMGDALSHFHAAIDGDPMNYMTYYKRATVYLAMGKSKSALPDLDKVIELKPDFTAARLQRANVKLKQGHLSDAETDYKEVLLKDPNNEAAKNKLSELGPLREWRASAIELYEDEMYQEVVDVIGPVIEACPWDPELHELRGESYIKLGDYFKAVGDIRPTTKLRTDNTAAYYKLSNLYYVMGESDTALSEIRECLKLDPDHRECFPFYKKVKKLVKQSEMTQKAVDDGRWEDCVSKADQMLVTEPNSYHFVVRSHAHRCHCYQKAQNIAEAYAACDKVLELDPNHSDAMCDKAEVYIHDEKFEEAVSQYQKAEETGGSTEKIEEGIKRAQKLLKQSQKRDYYKILGVKRNAKKREIEKAYRKQAVQWHPDKYEGEDKKRAEKNFIDIAAAKEVLTDPEMRQRFDNGEDPLDPEEQANRGGGGPWNQGFNPFGQGGFQFKFHFN